MPTATKKPTNIFDSPRAPCRVYEGEEGTTSCLHNVNSRHFMFLSEICGHTYSHIVFTLTFGLGVGFPHGQNISGSSMRIKENPVQAAYLLA